MTVKPIEPDKETKKGYFYSYEGNDAVDLSNLELKKKKSLNVTLNNTSGDSKGFISSNFAETIAVQAGAYSISLNGTNSNKTVKLGNTSGNSITVSNIGKNKITAGNGGNTFQTSNAYSNNTITAGIGVDTYYLSEGTTKITDKGGANYYSINGGLNNIIDKGNDGSRFNIYYTASSQGATKIKAGNGKDYLNIYNDYNPKNEMKITADLGKGDDEVTIDYKTGSEDNNDASIANIITGNGSDIVNIKAGKKNTIDTGKDKDSVHIYGGKTNYISTGDGADEIEVNGAAVTSTNIIKAGKGNDNIYVYAGDTTVYGEAGADTIEIYSNESTTVYGGGDTITVESPLGLIDVYAYSDTINLINGTNNIYTQKGGNTINVKGYTAGNAAINAIYLQKGNNTVNFSEGTTIKKAAATVHITSGKNEIIAEGYSFIDVDTNDKNGNTVNLKTAQTLNISGNAIVDSIELGKGNDIITNSSNANEGYDGCYSSHGTYAGAGNDKFYISNGSNKLLHGQEGNDYFEITSGTYHKVKGGYGDDTIIVNGGSNHNIECNGGKDKVTINGGNECQIYGNSGNDIFTIKGGCDNTIDGGEDNDTYNVYKGSSTINPITLSDNDGKNAYLIKKDYSGVLTISDTSNSSNVTFEDKSLKLSSEDNVDNEGGIITDGKTLSFWGNYNFYTKVLSNDGISLVFDLANEVSDKSINSNHIKFNNAENMTSYTIGGKKYTLDLTQLKNDLDQWYLANNDADFTTNNVLINGSDEQIKSLVALFAKDTQGCFI